jgi:hypothetical protein
MLIAVIYHEKTNGISAQTVSGPDWIPMCQNLSHEFGVMAQVCQCGKMKLEQIYNGMKKDAKS